jgi:hypothetical protein
VDPTAFYERVIMRFFVTAVTVVSAVAVTASLSLGIPGVPPTANAASIGVVVSQKGPFESDARLFPNAPQDEHLSDEERAAVNKPEHLRNEREKKLAISAREKMKTNEKYHGGRNKKKRENTKRKGPKGARTIKPPKPGWGGGGGRF